MKVTLRDISELQSGVYLKASENKTTAAAWMLGLKDFDDELQYLGSSASVDLKEVKEKYIVHKNHILFSTRLKFNAFYLPQNTNYVYVASNSFIIIKPDLDKVYPAYLTWYLNHPHVQQQFEYLSQATSRVPYLSQKKLESLEIELPELSIQKIIAKLYGLLNEEKQLTQKLIEKKEQYIQSILLKTSKQ